MCEPCRIRTRTDWNKVRNKVRQANLVLGAGGVGGDQARSGPQKAGEGEDTESEEVSLVRNLLLTKRLVAD